MQEELLRILESEKKAMIFVTHSIDEAILLGDRIVMMSRRPGRIREIITVNIPRPRKSFRCAPTRVTSNCATFCGKCSPASWITILPGDLLYEAKTRRAPALVHRRDLALGIFWPAD
jgi:ABC-type sulfate/molybdate transport systems ATPase subunit